MILWFFKIFFKNNYSYTELLAAVVLYTMVDNGNLNIWYGFGIWALVVTLVAIIRTIWPKLNHDR